MTREVLRGTTEEHRKSGKKELLVGLLMSAVGLAWLALEFTGGERFLGSGPLVAILMLAGPVTLLAGPLTALFGGAKLRQQSAPLVLDVSEESLRWSHGRDREQPVVREAVTSARWIGHRGRTWLSLTDGAGKPVASIPVQGFDESDVEASLARHGWPRVHDGRDAVSSEDPAAEVLHGGTLDHRIGTWFLLAGGAFLVVVGFWPFDNAAGAVLTWQQTWQIRVPFLVAAVPFLWFAVVRFVRPAPIQSISVSRDLARWSDGRKHEAAVPRAPVIEVRAHVAGKSLLLLFLDAGRESVGEFPIRAFDRGKVVDVFLRHGWPVVRD